MQVTKCIGPSCSLAGEQTHTGFVIVGILWHLSYSPILMRVNLTYKTSSSLFRRYGTSESRDSPNGAQAEMRCGMPDLTSKHRRTSVRNSGAIKHPSARVGRTVSQ